MLRYKFKRTTTVEHKVEIDRKAIISFLRGTFADVAGVFPEREGDITIRGYNSERDEVCEIDVGLGTLVAEWTVTVKEESE